MYITKNATTNNLFICRLGIFAIIMGIFISCNVDNDKRDIFDRKTMLTHWADNIIIPAYQQYKILVNKMDQAANTFRTSPSISNLKSLRTSWLNAYIFWQQVAMFEIGKSEEISLKSYTNIFPTDTTSIKKNIVAGTPYHLSSFEKQDEQGFPALDYLINGLRNTDPEIVNVFLQKTAQNGHKEYLVALTNRLNTLTSQVVSDWENDYRDTFINNDGSSATSSVNKTVNDFILYYEKNLRSGKIGIPTGILSGFPLSTHVEALYSKENSKELFIAALTNVQNFFNGVAFKKNQTGESLKSYLDFLDISKEDKKLSQIIDDQFDSIQNIAIILDDNFEKQVKTENANMVRLYNALQKNVIYMKVDMIQALNIRIDFVDSDGD